MFVWISGNGSFKIPPENAAPVCVLSLMFLTIAWSYLTTLFTCKVRWTMGRQIVGVCVLWSKYRQLSVASITRPLTALIHEQSAWMSGEPVLRLWSHIKTTLRSAIYSAAFRCCCMSQPEQNKCSTDIIICRRIYGPRANGTGGVFYILL